jgi:hypothetical protein
MAATDEASCDLLGFNFNLKQQSHSMTLLLVLFCQNLGMVL